MDERQSKAWIDWANGLIDAKLEGLASMLGEEMGRADKARDATIARLEARITALEEAMTKP